MFFELNSNYREQLRDVRIHLATPNKEMIGHLYNAKVVASFKMSSISELTITLPSNNSEEYFDRIKKKMLIRLKYSNKIDWFVIDSIEESSENNDEMTILAFSLGYELSYKTDVYFDEDEILNAEEALERAIEGTAWKVKHVDNAFKSAYRSIDIQDASGLDAVLQIGQSFVGIILWHPEDRELSLVEIDHDKEFKGLTVSYGRLLRSITRRQESDEMVTRLIVEGSEGLGIHGVNPTGQGYLEDFSYFMYPFERDENRNVIKKSDFMSDELCHALLDHEIAIHEHSPDITIVQDLVIEKEIDLMMLESQLSQLNLELETILALLDIAQSVGDEAVIEQRKKERNAKMSEIEAKSIEIGHLKTEIAGLKSQLNDLQDAITKESNFTEELLKELSLFIITKKVVNDGYIDEQELYEFGLEQFKRLRLPKVVLEVSANNLTSENSKKNGYNWDSLALGELVKVKYKSLGINQMSTIVEMDINFEEKTIDIKLANTDDLLTDEEKFIKRIYDSSTATTVLQNNKYKFNKIGAIEKEVHEIISNEWDANKNKIIAGVNNTIEVGNRGILIKTVDNPDEMVIMQAGIIALTEDGGETWKTAIRPDGVVAERLIGRIIAGQELIITNSGGTFTMDNTGFRIDASAFVVTSGTDNKNLVDLWNQTSDFVDDYTNDNILTPYEKKMIRNEWDKIAFIYNSDMVRLNDYFENNSGNNIPEVIEYQSRYHELFSYLHEEIQTDDYSILDPNNAEYSTRIDGSVFRDKFRLYEESKIKFDEIISQRAVLLSKQAVAIAQGARDMIDEISDDTVWKVELSSPKGFTFRNGDIATTITATVYRGIEDVTDDLDNDSFIWSKYDRNGILDRDWTNSKAGVGNVVEITSDDVHQRATFSCDIFVSKNKE